MTYRFQTSTDADDALRINRRLAPAEGWMLFDTQDSLAISRTGDILASRADALRFVLSCACAGSALHLDALHLLSIRGPAGYAHIHTIASAHERLALLSQGLAPHDPTSLPPRL